MLVTNKYIYDLIKSNSEIEKGFLEAVAESDENLAIITKKELNLESLCKKNKLTEAPDIFGIETDSEINKEAEAKKLAAYEKRKSIIDGDILIEINNNALADMVAEEKTLKDKKQAIIDFINKEIPIVRKGPDYRGISSFAYKNEYKNKPLDPLMVEKFADYYIDYWKNSNRIKNYRVYNTDHSWREFPVSESLENTVDQDLSDNKWPVKDNEEEIFEEPFNYKKEIAIEKGLSEDTIKQGNKWVNKGDTGKTHGEFKTKKAADAQRKAIYANGWKHEELEERLNIEQRAKYRDEIARITYNQAIIQDNGLFNIYNIKDDDLDRIINRLRNLDYIEWVNSSAGKYDFSHPQFMGPQKRYYNITGKIKDEEEQF